MISVFIDTAQLTESFNFDKKEINDLLDFTVKEMTARFAQEWESEALRTLHSARQEYISNLVVVDEGFAKGAVMLTGWLPNAIEQGQDAFDMKQGLLNGPNAKVSKNGVRYNIIPFSWGAPGGSQENFSGGILPKPVYDIINSKPQNVSLKGGSATKPLTLDELPKSFQQIQKKSIKMPGSKSLKEYTHKNSVYEGISKIKDNTTKQNSYISFRVVSDNSDSNSWLHPGFEAANIAEQALSNFNVPMETGRIIDMWLNAR